MHSIWKCILFSTLCITFIEGQCQTRNLQAAAEIGRACQKSCTLGDNQCRNRSVCWCDHECGYSCVSVENICKRPPTILNMESVRIYRSSNHMLVPAWSTQFEYDDVVEYVCKPGFKSEPPATVRRYCHGGGGWTGSTVCAPSCQRYNSHRVLANKMICGRDCVTDLNCLPGSSRCLCDGPCGRTCVKPDINCNAAPDAVRAQIKYTGEGFQRRAIYTCDPGFYAQSGDSVRKCTGSGTWDGQLISCHLITCGNPSESMQIMGGYVLNYQTGPYLVGDKIVVQCGRQRRLLGDRVRACLKTGQWSGTNTVCDIIDNEVRCPHPGVPVNGNLIGQDFHINSLVEFSCNPGFSMVGERKQECLYFLQWSGNGAPKCINPRHEKDYDAVFNKLQQSFEVSNVPTSEYGFLPQSELYLVIDISDDVREDALSKSLKFAEDRVIKMSQGGRIRCAILVFASDVHISHTLSMSFTQNIIKILRNIMINRQNLLLNIGVTRNTRRVLESLDEILWKSFDESMERDRAIFLLIHGRHMSGIPPQEAVESMRRSHHGLHEVFVVSYGEGFLDNISYEELQSLASTSDRFLANPNIENPKKYKKMQGTAVNVNSDQTTCGKAGDIGNIKNQARVAGRVVGGNKAAKGAWPWQVIMSIYSSSIFDTYNPTYGGGSLINNKWVLTAAHNFRNNPVIDKTDRDWTNNLLLTFGLDKVPRRRNERLPTYAKVFGISEVIIHPNFVEIPESYDYDIALVKVGREYEHDGLDWQPTTRMGWVTYTTYIKSICLPCMQDSCVSGYLQKINVLNGGESEEEKCRIESNWLNQDDEREDRNIFAVVTGFGAESTRNALQRQTSQYLKQGLIRLQHSSRCQNARDIMIYFGLTSSIHYTERMMCGIGGNQQNIIDACSGDSGGAFVREVKDETTGKSCWVQLGIVSWGLGCGQSYFRNGTLHPFPGFYTKVTSLISWVKDHISKKAICGVRDESLPKSLSEMQIRQRILSGHHAWPWQVRVNVSTTFGLIVCSGALISSRFVMSITSCVTSYSANNAIGSVIVQLPADNTIENRRNVIFYRSVDVVEVIRHPHYDSASFSVNDIALLRLAKTGIKNDYITPVCIPSTQEEHNLFIPGVTGFLVRYCLNSLAVDDVRLDHVSIPVLRQGRCQSVFKNLITNNSFCGITPQEARQCRGDSGGIWMLKHRGKYYAFGILAFGSTDSTYLGFTKIAPNYVDWIKSNTDLD